MLLPPLDQSTKNTLGATSAHPQTLNHAVTVQSIVAVDDDRSGPRHRLPGCERRGEGTPRRTGHPFPFTGGDLPHAHAHVIPMHEKTDITSARYILNPEAVEFRSLHLQTDQDSLVRVKAKLQLD